MCSVCYSMFRSTEEQWSECLLNGKSARSSWVSLLFSRDMHSCVECTCGGWVDTSLEPGHTWLHIVLGRHSWRPSTISSQVWPGSRLGRHMQFVNQFRHCTVHGDISSIDKRRSIAHAWLAWLWKRNSVFRYGRSLEKEATYSEEISALAFIPTTVNPRPSEPNSFLSLFGFHIAGFCVSLSHSYSSQLYIFFI